MENRSVCPKCQGGMAASRAGSTGVSGAGMWGSEGRTLVSRMASGSCMWSRVSEGGRGFILCVVEFLFSLCVCCFLFSSPVLMPSTNVLCH